MEETGSCLLDVHVRDDREEEDTQAQRQIKERAQIAPDKVDTPLFTGKEIATIVKSFKINKAPGLTSSKSQC